MPYDGRLRATLGNTRTSGSSVIEATPERTRPRPIRRAPNGPRRQSQAPKSFSTVEALEPPWRPRVVKSWRMELSTAKFMDLRIAPDRRSMPEDASRHGSSGIQVVDVPEVALSDSGQDPPKRMPCNVHQLSMAEVPR